MKTRIDKLASREATLLEGTESLSVPGNTYKILMKNGWFLWEDSPVYLLSLSSVRL